MPSKVKDFLKSLVIFDNLTKILNLYVLILAIIALLVTIGVFSIRVKPEVEILPPIYSFNIKRLITISTESNYSEIINLTPSLKEAINDKERTLLKTYGWTVPKKDEISLFLPFETLDTNSKKQGWSSNTANNLLYRLGIETTSPDSIVYRINNSAERTIREKYIGINFLILDALFKDLDIISKDSTQVRPLAFGLDTFSTNPIIDLNNIKPKVTNIKNYEDFISKFGLGCTRVYSCISISNTSNEILENISLYINDVMNYGMLEIIGWTKGASNIEIKSNSINKLILLDKLEPHQSVEILFRGFKYIRENEISISLLSPPVYNKKSIYIIVIGTLLIVIFLYFMQWYKHNK